MAASIAELVAELRSQLSTNAAEYPGVPPLRAGASAEALVACETAIGRPLPPQLRELLTAADGQDANEDSSDFPAAPWSSLLGASDIARLYNDLDTILSECEREFD